MDQFYSTKTKILLYNSDKIVTHTNIWAQIWLLYHNEWMTELEKSGVASSLWNKTHAARRAGQVVQMLVRGPVRRICLRLQRINPLAWLDTWPWISLLVYRMSDILGSYSRTLYIEECQEIIWTIFRCHVISGCYKVQKSSIGSVEGWEDPNRGLCIVNATVQL